MRARRGLLLAGSLWELVRFFLVLFLFASVLRGTSGAGPWVFSWLLVAGSGNLLIAAGGGMLALFPERYARLIALLRLGKAMSVFSFILLVVSGSLGIASGYEFLGIGRRALTGGAVLLFVFFMGEAVDGRIVFVTADRFLSRLQIRRPQGFEDPVR